ncbi:TetR/AcrR family transcriptional regulator [Microbacterium sp. JZ37]|uniref:TetR/AcrR family transcriptional regulator n=1 Tax=Microbacterium sp. JZ37 TaxID=2654193 RepID=UPI002B483EF4|nr:TetR/AcrR family transcriptional regulator [Microbacterium sp. JZ37]WRH18738.1 TetR family transcriptional regulator [Microbacterium sp. JZ37]
MPDDTGPRRRQARGRARMEQILQAAAAVFGEVGYEAATTNAIAARAGISPGSLYQFFANKDEVGRALAETYAERLATLDVLAGFRADSLDGALRDALDRITAFNIDHPGFKALFARTDMPASMREAVAPAHAAIEERIRGAVAAVLPHADQGRVHTTATVILSMVKGLLPVIVAEADDDRRRALADELHRGVLAYLTAVRREVDQD